MKNIVFATVFVFSMAALSAAEPYTPDLLVLPEEFSSYTRITVESGSMYSRPYEGVQNYTIDSQTGIMQYSVITEGYTYSYTIDRYLNLIEAHGVYTDIEFIESTDFTEVIARDVKENNVHFEGKKTNGRWKIKNIRNGSDAVFGEAASFYFQTVFIQNGGVPVEGTAPTLFFPHSPVNIGFITHTITSTGIPSLVDDYKIPEAFMPFVESGMELIVVESFMRGIAGAFFPHKFFFAYNTSYPYELVAMWGGDYGESDYFIYMKEYQRK